MVFSYRSRPLGFEWPENMEEHPLLTHLEGNIAHFKDGEQSFFFFFFFFFLYLLFISFYPQERSMLLFSVLVIYIISLSCLMNCD